MTNPRQDLVTGKIPSLWEVEDRAHDLFHYRAMVLVGLPSVERLAGPFCPDEQSLVAAAAGSLVMKVLEGRGRDDLPPWP
jgi:hypothetical protein